MVKFMIVVLVALLSMPAMAKEEVTIYFGGLSKHFGSTRQYNENNTAFGVGYKSIEAFVVDNSYSIWGVGIYYHPKYKTKYVDFGIRMGGTTGYKDTEIKMAITPIVQPTITMKYKNFGLELGALPTKWVRGSTVDCVGTLLLNYKF